MMRTLLSALLLPAIAIGPAAALSQEEIVMKNAGLSRTVSLAAGLVKTTKLIANGIQMLDGPSVEFMLDIDYKGEAVTLVPSDFDFKGTDSQTQAHETHTILRFDSHYPGIPVTVHLNYYTHARNNWIQKSVTVSPCKKAEGAILRRVVIDDFRFVDGFRPVSPIDRFSGAAADAPRPDLSDTQARFRLDITSDFAAIDAKANRGIYFFVDSPFASERFTNRGRLVLSEDTFAPLEKGHETARATIGAAAGPAEVLYKRFRQFLWDNCCAARGRSAPAEDSPAAIVFVEDRDHNKPQSSSLREERSKLRKTNPEALICLSPGPMRPPEIAHRLSIVDLIEFENAAADTALGARQQRFVQGFVFPPRTMAVSMRADIAAVPSDRFDYTLLSTISDPALSFCRPDAVTIANARNAAYLRRLCAFKQRHARYFDVYQHVLGFPDGLQVDGEAHIVDGRGFILLFNPAHQSQAATLPLHEPGLELRGTVKLSDYSDLDTPKAMGSAETGDRVEVELGPVSVKVVGVNIE